MGYLQARLRSVPASQRGGRRYIDDIALASGRTLGKGRGLFATQFINKGTVLYEYTGRVTTRRAEDASSAYRMNVRVEGRLLVIDAQDVELSSAARFINHSAAASANCKFVERAGRVFVVTTRKIKPGDELLVDYGTAARKIVAM